jgi:dUTP pyrophosphatase
MKMFVKIKRLSDDAVIPSYAKDGDAGMDLTATSVSRDHRDLVGGLNTITYGTSLAVEVPKGYVGLLFPRSSVYKTDLNLSNCVGVIDSGYRGELMMKFRLNGRNAYKEGDRIGQLIIMPHPEVVLEEVDELSDSERGTSGYGSSGK